MKFVLTVFILLASHTVFADQTSDGFGAFKDQYCTIRMINGLPDSIRKVCMESQTFSELQTAIDKIFVTCNDKATAAHSVDEVAKCNKNLAFVDAVKKAFQAGVKAAGCASSGSTNRAPHAAK
jgi:hypothetical protein